MAWAARTKDDLVIEVWEKLDCENVGAAEIEAIETAVAAEFGRAAVDSPMLIARLLADEGAELRHAEIMALHVSRAESRPYDAAFENLIRLDDLRSSLSSVRNIENLRKKFAAARDRDGLQLLRKNVLSAKEALKTKKADELKRQINIEIVEWLSHWLQTPELFETWVGIRISSRDFIEKFGRLKD
jgi:hypothetical protein